LYFLSTDWHDTYQLHGASAGVEEHIYLGRFALPQVVVVRTKHEPTANYRLEIVQTSANFHNVSVVEYALTIV